MAPWLVLAVLVAVLDQLTKQWVLDSLIPGQVIPVTGFFDLVLLFNPGAAFSFLADHDGWQRWFFTALALTVSAGIVAWLRGVHARAQAWLACGLALVLGGALGNVIDRMRHGFVIDFVHVHWNDAWFPAFNVADAAISVGAACLVMDAIVEWRRARP